MSLKIFEEALELVYGDRGEHYGHPSDNHGCTAEMWSAYLRRRGWTGPPLTVRDVCWMNVAQKMSRDANAPKRDNIVDSCGYLGNVEMDEERRSP